MIAAIRLVVGLSFLVLSTNPFTTARADVQMKPLSEILAAENSVAITSTMLERCSALFTVIGYWFGSQSDVEKQELGLFYERQAVVVFLTWRVLQEGSLDLTEEQMTGLFRAQLKILVPEYQTIMSRAKALTGDSTSDPVVRSDLDTCGRYRQITEQRLRDLANR